jgi:hypothetical protein
VLAATEEELQARRHWSLRNTAPAAEGAQALVGVPREGRTVEEVRHGVDGSGAMASTLGRPLVVEQQPGVLLRGWEPHAVLSQGGGLRVSANFLDPKHLVEHSIPYCVRLEHERRAVRRCARPWLLLPPLLPCHYVQH